MRRGRGFCNLPGCEWGGCGERSLEMENPILMIWFNLFLSPRLSQPRFQSLNLSEVHNFLVWYSFFFFWFFGFLGFFAWKLLIWNLTYGALSLHEFRTIHVHLGKNSRLLESPGTVQGLAGKFWIPKKLEKS